MCFESSFIPQRQSTQSRNRTAVTQSSQKMDWVAFSWHSAVFSFSLQSLSYLCATYSGDVHAVNLTLLLVHHGLGLSATIASILRRFYSAHPTLQHTVDDRTQRWLCLWLESQERIHGRRLSNGRATYGCSFQNTTFL